MGTPGPRRDGRLHPPGPPESELTRCAAALALEVLAPCAEEVDRTGRIPDGHLDALRDARLFGLWAPPELGGWGSSEADALAVYETLAGACGSTYFLWWQHHTLVRKLVGSPNRELADRWLPRLAAGVVTAGDINYLRRPEPQIRAHVTASGYEIVGVAPWVAGWGAADVFVVAATREDGQAIYVLVPADSGGLDGTLHHGLLAMSAAGNATVTLDGVAVPHEHVVDTIDIDAWRRRDPRRNAQPMPAAIGVAARAAELLVAQSRSNGSSDFAAEADRLAREVDDCRSTGYHFAADVLAGADVPVAEQVAARAWSHELSMRVTGALIAAGGGRSVERGNPGQRLYREAAFHSIQGQTPLVKAATIGRLAPPPASDPGAR